MPRIPIGGGRESWIVKYDGQRNVWKVKKEGAAQALRNFETKQPAVSYGARKARSNKPSILSIYNKTGGMGDQRKYGSV